ncbi:DNA polymerase III subunit beta [Mesomycoplasma lagogenitalium]|uniref:DNA polymerase III subunit beta n=1 Tax=Mesomycoplasma lagogenitalium TaxID=171286 RepID=A0ABY8LV69_9BACT|nr:DNA polymerase III subunit beta [Mesomycoplasma lagogenitalium]WGI36660.1 DNA polymerase III subunit beta [Mesomycoplasma lagogenitalium]
MKFIISKKIFEKEFDRVGTAINSINFLNSLRGIYIELKQEGLYLTGSDGELSIKGFIEKDNIQQIVEPGVVLVNYYLMKNIIKKTSGILEFELKDKNLSIKNDDDVYKLNVMDNEEYPLINFEFFGSKIIVNSDNLRNAVKNTSFAATSDSVEMVFNCLNLVAKNGQLTISATDRYRIAVETISIASDAEFNISIVAKNFKDFIPSDYHGDIEIYVDNNKLETKIENTRIQCKVLDFPYKDLSNVFPSLQDLIYKIDIEKKDLIDLISKATAISSDLHYKLKILVNENEFSMIGDKEEMGTINVKTKNFKYQSKEHEVFFALNHKYLKEAISVFEGKIHMFVDKSIKRVFIISPSNTNNKQLIGTT